MDVVENNLHELSFEELALTWKAMPRTSESENQDSEDYYKTKLFPKVLERVCREQGTRTYGDYDLLISTLGTAPEPVMLTICLLKPRRVVLLCDPETESFIATIRQQTAIDAQCLDREFVEKNNTLTIYQAVHAAIQKEAKRLGRPPKVAIDMTGGTKLMGAGCAMAGVLIGADIFYLSSGWDPVCRRAVPGTERLVRFQDPYAEFGDLEADKARARFARHDYAGAAQLFEEIAEKVAQPRTYQCLGHLSRAYEAWDALRIEGALEHLSKACSMIQRFRSDSATMKSLPLDTLEHQRRALERLHSVMAASKLSLSVLQDADVFAPLLFTVVENASRSEDRESYETASLLLYRAIEMMAQRRLALLNFDTGKPDYGVLGIDPVNDVEKISAKLKLHKAMTPPLPPNISLFMAHVLLSWVKDPYAVGKHPVELGRLSHVISTRNEGLYAHGFKPTNKMAHGAFRSFADSCLQKLCSVEGWELEQMSLQCRFIRLPVISITSS